MPRRPRKVPAGKKDSGSRSKKPTQQKKWNTRSEIEVMDDGGEDACMSFSLFLIVDLCYNNALKVNRARDDDSSDNEGPGQREDEEVFGLDLSDAASSSSSESELEPEFDTPKEPKRAKKSKPASKISDSEVDDDEESEEEEEGWGTKKSTYYSSNHTRSDEDYELELQEAIRLQKKNLADWVSEDRGDFGGPDLDSDLGSSTLHFEDEQEVETVSGHGRSLEIADPISLALSRDFKPTVQALSRVESRYVV
jgi:hypothetical protein